MRSNRLRLKMKLKLYMMEALQPSEQAVVEGQIEDEFEVVAEVDSGCTLVFHHTIHRGQAPAVIVMAFVTPTLQE